MKGKAKAQPTKKEQLRVSIPQPKEERKKPKPLSPKNEWVTNVQALKHEFQEKAGGGDENTTKKKDLSIKVEVDLLDEQKLIIQPPSATNRQMPPKKVRSPSHNSAQSSPKTTRSREPCENMSPNSASSRHRSPRSPSQQPDRYSPRPKDGGKSPTSASKSPRSPPSRYGGDHSTLDLRRKEKLLSKSSKSKSSKKYSSTLHADKKAALKTEDKPPKPVETKVVLEPVLEARDDIPTPKVPGSSKRDTVLGVLAEPHSPLPTPRMPPLEEIKPGDLATAPKGKKQGWFGFRKGKGSKDPSKLPPHPTSNKDATSKPPTPTPTAGSGKKVRTPQDSSQPSSHESTPASSTDVAGPAAVSLDDPNNNSKLTSPLQLQLWLGTVKASIVRVRPDDVKSLLAAHDKRVTSSTVPRIHTTTPRSNNATTPRSITPRSIPLAAIAEEENQQEANNNYFLNAQEYGVYVDYSTFDDNDSVSSIVLLCKWLTCRDLGDGTRHQTISEGGNPEGMVVSDHGVIDSDVSFDAEAQPRRRVLFSP